MIERLNDQKTEHLLTNLNNYSDASGKIRRGIHAARIKFAYSKKCRSGLESKETVKHFLYDFPDAYWKMKKFDSITDGSNIYSSFKYRVCIKFCFFYDEWDHSGGPAYKTYGSKVTVRIWVNLMAIHYLRVLVLTNIIYRLTWDSLAWRGSNDCNLFTLVSCRLCTIFVWKLWMWGFTHGRQFSDERCVLSIRSISSSTSRGTAPSLRVFLHWGNFT